MKLEEIKNSKDWFVVNLDGGFIPIQSLTTLQYGYNDFKRFAFPSGIEQQFNFVIPENAPKNCLITARINQHVDLITLFLATDSIKRQGYKVSLFLPYIPYARQDRVCVPGDALSIKVFADLINLQGYEHVFVFDPHSDVTPALINNCEVIDNEKLIKKVLRHKNLGLGGISLKSAFLVSPDAGAYKKVSKLNAILRKEFNIQPYPIIATKLRDLSTGELSSTQLHEEDLEGNDCYIIDDICSRGGTFIALAKLLKERNAGKVFLIVSHYEDSANIRKLQEYLDGVFTTDSFSTISEASAKFVTQVKLRDLI